MAIPYATLHRFAVEEVGFGRKRVTMPDEDGDPGVEIQIDVGWLTTILPDEHRRRRRPAVELTKRRFDPDATYDYDRPFAALQGLAKLHHSEVAALLVEKLPSLTESVDGDDLLLLRNSSPCPVVT